MRASVVVNIAAIVAIIQHNLTHNARESGSFFVNFPGVSDVGNGVLSDVSLPVCTQT